MKLSPRNNKIWMWIWAVTSVLLIFVVVYSFSIGDKSGGTRILVLTGLSLLMFILRFYLYRQSRNE